MNIQIFGKSKCFDTKKAERFFKERRIKYQFVDINKFGMSRGELNSVKNAVGLDAMLNKDDVDYPLVQYLKNADSSQRQAGNCRLSARYMVKMGIEKPPGGGFFYIWSESVSRVLS